MSEQIAGQEFSLVIPESLGGGRLTEDDYEATPGTRFVLNTLLGVESGEELEAGSLLKYIGAGEGGEEYLTGVINDSSGSSLLRELYDTEGLITDHYDIAEVMRLTEPMAAAIEANFRLQRAVGQEEMTFLVRRASLMRLYGAIDTELRRPYRSKTVGEMPAVSYPTPKDSYSIEDEIINAVDAARRGSALDLHTAADRIRTAAVGAEPVGAEKYLAAKRRVEAFAKGEVSHIDFADVSLVHTVEVAEIIDRIATASTAGRISVQQAAGAKRQFAWSGRQVEIELPWRSVVSGGSVSQN